MIKRTNAECLLMARDHLRAAKAGGAPLDDIMKLTEQIRSLEIGETAPQALPDPKRRMDPVPA